MIQRRKRWLWTTISSAALFVPIHLENTGATSGLTGSLRSDPAVLTDQAPGASGEVRIAQARGSMSGPGGEGGEGGEKGVGAALATDDIAYLTQLGLIRGHLFVGHQLYQAGHKEAAKTHMKHPADEIYSFLVKSFQARGVDGFADGLEKLAILVEGDASLQKVNGAYQSLQKAIRATTSGIPLKSNQNVKDRLNVIVDLVRVAGEEYAIGVVKGKIVNLHEYQDALGFVEVAKQTLAQITDQTGGTHNEALLKVKTQLDGLKAAFPTLMPKSATESQDIFTGAAARIELAALSIKG